MRGPEHANAGGDDPAPALQTMDGRAMRVR